MKEIMKEEITKEKLTNKLNNTFLRPFRWLMIISMLCIISSIFVLIWGPWALTWKLCLFGISGFIIFGVIHKIMKISIIKGIEDWEKLKNKEFIKSKFITEKEKEDKFKKK